MKYIGVFFSIILLIYMLLPGPSLITQFKPLPASDKSNYPGDTVQVPNIAAYYSNNYRSFVMPYYVNDYKSLTMLPFSPYRINYPPEFAYTAIKDQTDSTYLEEIVYPLRDSIYVNGFEPFEENGKPKYDGSTKVSADGVHFVYTKTIIRFYPSIWEIRVLVWLGINLSVYGLWKVGRSIVFNG